ncbi:MAG: hypothetical protein KDK41_02010 [Leptospiraceae bacterium]|nr:hypothetical protein [Leptospiraceae bacterium]
MQTGQDFVAWRTLGKKRVASLLIEVTTSTFMVNIVRLRLLCVIIFTFLFSSEFLAAQTLSDGVSVPVMRAKNLLNLPFGARSIGMGSAQTGRADDLSAMSYNPAGLSLMGYWEWSLLHQDYQNDVKGNLFLLSAPLPYGSIGVQAGIYTVRDNNYISGGLHSHPDRNKLAYQTGLTYAAPVFKRFVHVGLQMKYFGADFSSGTGAGNSYPVKESGLFFDLGVIGTYDLSDLKGFFFYLPKVSGGFTVKNMHPRFGMAHEVGDDFTPEYNLGISLYYSHRAMLNFDIVNRQSLPTIFRSGIEFWPVYFLALRTGFGFGGTSSQYRSIHWGVGLGQSISKSKVIVEYSGFEERVTGWEASRQTYHSLSLNQSFDNIIEYKTASGKEKKIPLAKSDRYNSAYKFLTEVIPTELIEDVVAYLRQFSGSDNDTPSIYPASSGTTGATASYSRRAVAVYPMPIEFVSGSPENVEYAKDVRLALVRYLSNSPTMTPVPLGQIRSATSGNGSGEPIGLLENLCLRTGASLIVMGKVIVDDEEEKVIVKLMYYNQGSRKIATFSDRAGSYRKLPELYSDVIEEFKLQAGSLLNLEAL